MECELCGQSIKGRPVRIRLEGVLLLVCENCARKYSEYIVRERGRRVGGSRSIRRTTRRITRMTLVEYDIVEDYSDRIREAREALGLTRELLARSIGEKESVIRRLEEGRLVPTIELARKLERTLGIKLIIPQEEEAYISPPSGSRFELTLGDIVVIRERRRQRERKAESHTSREDRS